MSVGKQSIGGASTKVRDANPMRTILYLSNDSDEDLYVAINEAAILNQGIILQVGAVPVVLRDGDPGLRGAIHAISTTGGKNLAFLEL